MKNRHRSNWTSVCHNLVASTICRSLKVEAIYTIVGLLSEDAQNAKSLNMANTQIVHMWNTPYIGISKPPKINISLFQIVFWVYIFNIGIIFSKTPKFMF
jgi:hypothetical protein